MRIGVSILCGFALATAIGCSDSSRPTLIQPPDFRIVDFTNTSTREQKRYNVKIVLPSHYSEILVRSLLITIADTINEPESEITMVFYGPESNTRGEYDVARVVWKRGLSEMDYRQPNPPK